MEASLPNKVLPLRKLRHGHRAHSESNYVTFLYLNLLSSRLLKTDLMVNCVKTPNRFCYYEGGGSSVFLEDPQATCCKIEKTSHFWMGILMENPTWSPDLCTDFHLGSLLSKGEREEGPKGGTIFNCTLICSPLSLSLAQKSTYWTSTLVVLRFVMFQFWARERERGGQKGGQYWIVP